MLNKRLHKTLRCSIFMGAWQDVLAFYPLLYSPNVMRCPSPLQPQLLYSSMHNKKHILYTHPMCVVFVSNLLSVLRSVLLYHIQDGADRIFDTKTIHIR